MECHYLYISCRVCPRPLSTVSVIFIRLILIELLKVRLRILQNHKKRVIVFMCFILNEPFVLSVDCSECLQDCWLSDAGWILL